MDKKYMALFGIIVLLSSSVVMVFSSNTRALPRENLDTDEILFNWIEFEKDVNFVYLDFIYTPNHFDKSYSLILPIVVYDRGSTNEYIIGEFTEGRIIAVMNDPKSMSGYVERVDIVAMNPNGDTILLTSMSDIEMEIATRRFTGNV